MTLSLQHQVDALKARIKALETFRLGKCGYPGCPKDATVLIASGIIRCDEHEASP